MDIDINRKTPGNSKDIKNYEKPRVGEDVKLHDTSGFEDGDTPSRCRACLLSGVKLFNIHEYKLADALSRVTGAPVCKDGLPQHLCWYCRAVLLRWDAFRDKCLRSQGHLMAALQGKRTTDCIRKLDQHPILTLSPIQTVDYTDVPPDDIKKEPDPDIDLVDIERIINKSVLKTEQRNEVTIGNKDESIVNVEQDVKKRKRTAANKNIELDDSNEDSDNFDTENLEIEIGVDNTTSVYASSIDIAAPMKRGGNNEKKRKTVKKIKKEIGTDESKDLDVNTKPKEVKRRRKKKEEVMRKFRNPENDYMPVFDFGNFESLYAVKIVTLSKEEQLGEIASRKESSNYLESPLRCEDCGKGFLAETAYNNHRQRHSPSAGPYACEICNARFKMKCRRQEHQDMHRLKFFCKECGFVSRARHQARKHHAMHAGKTYECQHCGKSFNKSSTYLSHVRLAHPAMNVACDLCGETFVGQVGLRQHKAKMHSEITKPQFKCATCSASFVSLDALNAHTDTGEHSGRPCEQCGESCASEEALQTHVGERHPTESHRCEECNATFSSSASYDLHHRRKHLNQPFSAAGRQPARTYRASRGQFVCEQCGRVMPTPTLLRLHQRIHNDVKPFACPECPKTFAAKHARDWHIRSHTGERPFQCPLCPLAFSIKSNYKRHHKAVHLGQRARVPCAICARVFTTNSCLRVHVDMVHRGAPWPKRDRKRKKQAKQ